MAEEAARLRVENARLRNESEESGAMLLRMHVELAYLRLSLDGLSSAAGQRIAEQQSVGALQMPWRALAPPTVCRAPPIVPCWPLAPLQPATWPPGGTPVGCCTDPALQTEILNCLQRIERLTCLAGTGIGEPRSTATPSDLPGKPQRSETLLTANGTDAIATDAVAGHGAGQQLEALLDKLDLVNARLHRLHPSSINQVTTSSGNDNVGALPIVSQC